MWCRPHDTLHALREYLYEHWYLSLATSTEYSTGIWNTAIVTQLPSQRRRKSLVSFSDTLCQILVQVRSGGALASHQFGLMPGWKAGWCLRLTFASSSARGMGHTSQLWRSFWDYMVCVLGSSSLCAWSGFMRDASRLDSNFFFFLFPFFDLRISLSSINTV